MIMIQRIGKRRKRGNLLDEHRDVALSWNSVRMGQEQVVLLRSQAVTAERVGGGRSHAMAEMTTVC